MKSLYDHDKTQVLSTSGRALEHDEPAESVMRDDGTSLVVLPAEYVANITFRRMSGDGWSGEKGYEGYEGYEVTAFGPAKFVSDVLAAASGYFLDSEER